MEMWKDQGIVLAARAHGEGGAVVSLLTENHGRHAGFVRGLQSSRMRAMLQQGCLVAAEWKSRRDGDLGAYELEPGDGAERGVTGGGGAALSLALALDDPLRLAALLSACALCDEAIPEREGTQGLFHGLRALISTLEGDAFGAAYVMWEIALLRELGFALDLSSCAAGGSAADLAYVSPKSGRAVSAERGAPYRDRLLPLPRFLMPERQGGDDADILTGLVMTEYFLEHWVFAHHSRGIPEQRLRFRERFAKTTGQTA